MVVGFDRISTVPTKLYPAYTNAHRGPDSQPRLTVLEDRIYITYAMYTKHGCCGTTAVADDWENIEILSSVVPDNHDIVLFPERINDRYIRLERPFPIGSRSQRLYDIWISESPDLVYCGKPAPM